MSDQWQQAWSVQPVTDGDDLRRLRVLYRGAAQDVWEKYLPIEMPNPQYSGANKPPASIADPFFQQGIHAVRNFQDMCKKWIFYTGLSDERRPPPGEEIVELGTYGNNRLFMTKKDRDKGCLSRFVILVLDASGATASPSKGSQRGPKKGGGGATTQEFPMVPNVR